MNESKLSEIVTTLPLSFFPNTDNVFAELREFGVANAVKVNLDTAAPVQDGYQITLTGRRGFVAKCIKKHWASENVGFTTEEADAYVEMMLGSELGQHRFDTGCTIESGDAWNYSRFQWNAHWKAAGAPVFESRNEAYDRAMEAAIELLALSGYEPSDNEDSVDLAQSYLALAYLHCPKLIPSMVIRAATVEEAIEALKPVGWEPPTKQPSYDGVMLDAFNLFEGAAFRQLNSETVWVVMNFTDLGGTAHDEHVRVFVRQADDKEKIVCKELIFHYSDKVILHGNVRNKFDFDDNNWGQN